MVCEVNHIFFTRQALPDGRGVQHHGCVVHSRAAAGAHNKSTLPRRSSCSHSLQIRQFTLLPSASFLCLLDKAPTTTTHSQNVRISLADGRRYDILADKAQTVVLALKNIDSKAERDAADAAEAEDRG